MESWFIYTLLSVFLAGLFSFSSKISVEKKHNPWLVTFFSMSTATMCWIIYFMITKWTSSNLFLEISLWIANWLLYLITNVTRIKSLNYIDTSVYFPIYKSIWPILILLITVLIFSESFNSKESIWIILWILVPLLLISKKSNNKDIKKWLFYMIIWLLTATWAAVTVKIWTIYEANMLLYAVFSLFSGTIWSYFFIKKKNKKNISYSLLKIKRIWFITWVLNFFAFYFFIKAIELNGSLWLVYVFQSLYIIIPIILSIIIYKEHFDFKKFIAIILTIASIYFMK